MDKTIVCDQRRCTYNDDGKCSSDTIYIDINATCDSFSEEED